MKDTASWVIGFFILMALFNKQCQCTDHLMYYFGPPNPPGASHEAP